MPHWLDSWHAIDCTSTMVNLNSVGRSFYVLSNILLGIKHKKGNKKVHQGKKSLVKKYLIPTIHINIWQHLKGQELTLDNMFDISVSCQSPLSATQLSSSVCRMVVVFLSPGPVTGRRTAWMPVMRGTVRQVILSSYFLLSRHFASPWDYLEQAFKQFASWSSIIYLSHAMLHCIYLSYLIWLVMIFIFSLHSSPHLS